MLLVELWHLVVFKGSIEFRFPGPVGIYEADMSTIAAWTKPPNKIHASTWLPNELSLHGFARGSA